MEPSHFDLLRRIERFRGEGRSSLTLDRQSSLGQFFTPPAVARLMSSLVKAPCARLRILDPGAGTGVLFASCVAELLARAKPPQHIEVVAYEVDRELHPYLDRTLEACRQACLAQGIDFNGAAHHEDFIRAATAQLKDDLFGHSTGSFSLAILNPPYKKISCQSETRALLRAVGMETTNLYSAFVWLASRLLIECGELVAITPRSFCNGPYFRHFRRSLLEVMRLRHLHVFEARDRAFHEDEVLQENVIFHAGKDLRPPKYLHITSSPDPVSPGVTKRVEYRKVVRPDDPDYFIHIMTDSDDDRLAERLAALHTTLHELGLEVSTGRVVDFRAKDHLRHTPTPDSHPLIYPTHFAHGFVNWPRPDGKKPNALRKAPETDSLLVPAGHYVLTRRFSAKEEARRIVAAVYDPGRVAAPWVAFENHLNYYHVKGQGLPPDLTKGLAVYLNSSAVDRYFRQFNGHTQVNATDLRKLKYPARDQLIRLGSLVRATFPTQDAIDRMMESEILSHAGQQ